jgi:hypothetical protein
MTPGLVRVGHRSQLIEDGALDVEFGLVTSHPGDVEAAAVGLLAGRRLHEGREFFEASVDEAIAAVRSAATEVAGLQRWADEGEYHRIRADDRVSLTTMAGQLFFHVHYPDSHALLTNQPVPADIWQAHSDGDSLEMMAVTEPNAVISAGDDDPDNSWTDPMPYLDRAQTCPNVPINGKERIRAGDRLIWLAVKNDQSSCHVTVFDFDDDCQVISRTYHPQTMTVGDTRHPLLLNMLTYEKLPPEMIRTAHSVLEEYDSPTLLGTPVARPAPAPGG